MDDDDRLNDSEERPRIKVTDRRKFTADGTPRNSEPADAPTPAPLPTPAPTPLPTPAPATGNQETIAGTDSPPPVEPGTDEPGDAAPQSSVGDLPRDFSAFVEGMYLEAMLYLGALPDPRSGEVTEDVELARYKIDLLAMIQEKTQGNLSDDEKRQLEGVLYQLRTVYVQKTQAADS